MRRIPYACPAVTLYIRNSSFHHHAAKVPRFPRVQTYHSAVKALPRASCDQRRRISIPSRPWINTATLSSGSPTVHRRNAHGYTINPNDDVSSKPGPWLGDESYRRLPEKLLKNVPSMDFDAMQRKLFASRVGKTMEWFKETEGFKKWMQEPEYRVLICPGEVGAGKTTTASIVAQHLKDLVLPNAALGFIFLDHHREGEQSVESISASLVRQVAELHPNPEIAQKAWDFLSVHDVNRWWELDTILDELYNQSSSVYLVVDGLSPDDPTCNANESIERLLKLSDKVKVFVTATMRDDLDTICEAFNALREDVVPRSSDLELYINERIARELAFAQESSDLIMKRVLEFAETSFLLTRLIMDQLSRLQNKEQILHALEHLPKSTEQAYEQVMAHIKELDHSQRDIAMKTICWTVFDTGLTMDELQNALKIASAASASDNELYSCEAIISACQGVITAQTFPGHYKPALSHSTLYSFFQRNRHRYFPDANAMLGELCINYLKNPLFTASQSPWVLGRRWSHDAHFSEYPFLWHAMEHWGTYAARGEAALVDKLWDYLADEDRLVFAAASRIPPMDGEEEDYTSWNALHVASMRGFSEVVQRLLSVYDDITVAKPTAQGRTALSWAAARGHTEIVRALLKRPLNQINTPDNKGRTPLSWAAERNRIEVIRLLLEDAEVIPDIPDSTGRTPLSYAAGNGFKGVVELLLQRGDVDPDVADSENRTALSYVASSDLNRDPVIWVIEDGIITEAEAWGNMQRDPEGVAQLLLQRKDVQPDKTDNSGRTPLCYAAGHGQAGIVSQLLENPDVNADRKDNDGRTPLSYATRSKESIRLLLNRKDVDPNSRDASGRTILSHAVVWFDSPGLELLLNCPKVELEAEDDSGRTPLSYAASWGNLDALQSLLGRSGVQADRKNRNGRTPLSYAAEGFAGPDALAFLLEHPDIDINSTCNKGRTPLSYLAADLPIDMRSAAFMEDKEVDEQCNRTLSLFLSNPRLKINIQDHAGRTALSHFAEKDWIPCRVASMLKVDGIEVDLADNEGRTPLWYAIKEVRPGTISLLREATKTLNDETTKLLEDWERENSSESEDGDI